MLDALWRDAQFWGQCLVWAAKGTVERANAWFWLIGIPIVSAGGRYWEVGELTIPDNVTDLLVFMTVTIAVSWVVFFLIRLIGAPSRLFWAERKEKTELQNAFDKANEQPIEIVFEPSDSRYVRTFEERTGFYVGIHVISHKTVDYPSLRVSRSPFTERVIWPYHKGGESWNLAFSVYKGGALDPDVTEIIELLALPFRKYLTDDLMLNKHTFTLEARCRNAKPCFAEFEYDPDRTPMIRRIA